MPRIEIEFLNKQDLTDSICLTWKLHDTPVAYRWLERLATAQYLKYSIDDPERFYGFNDRHVEEQIALERINQDIVIINDHSEIIDRKLESVNDQDTLNYLHHVFEVYHGLLDQQNTDFWNAAPVEVQRALARLNIDVHRCETVYRSCDPRMVMTYYGLPKDTLFRHEDYKFITNRRTFGTMYINYAEIGKTLLDHYLDNDAYIDPLAFAPYMHCSADFNVDFVNDSIELANEERRKVWNYFLLNRTKFEALGCSLYDPKNEPGKIPVAELEQELDLEDIKTRQFVKRITIL